MPDTEHQKRHRFTLNSSVLGYVLVAVCASAFALDPSLDVNQYAHRAWRIREGFTKGVILAMAQTPDGYLWLGTDLGLLRFDGVRTVPFHLSGDQHLPSDWIIGLLVSRDGTLWIGTSKGLASWKNGKLNQYADLGGQYVFRLLEDHEGTVWAGSYSLSTGRLCAIQKDVIHCEGKDGSLGLGVWDLYEDSKGNLWVSVLDGLWRWKPGASEFHAMPGQRDRIRGFAESDDGTLLFGSTKGIQQIVDGNIVAHPLPGNAPTPRSPNAMLRDRDGGLWIGTYGQGIVHVHNGQTDVFAVPEGLTGDVVSRFLEDREGNVWAATQDGLDCFRALAVTTISQKQGLLDANPTSTLADKDGSVWLGTAGGLNKWNHGQISTYGKDGKLNGDAPNSIFQDGNGRIWVSTVHGFGYLQNDRFIPMSGVPGGFVHGIAEDESGNLWIAHQQAGLLHLLPAGKVEPVPWDGLGRKDYARALAADPVRGGLWLGFANGGIVYFADGAVRESYSSANGLGDGWIERLRVDSDDTLWAATQGGLSRLKNGRVATLSVKNGLPCDGVHWSTEDDDHALWIYMSCGLVRIARSELDAWAAAADKGESATQTIHPMVFDTSDGVRSQTTVGGFFPHVAKSSDGKLWFVSTGGIGVIDPQHLVVNKLPPPVEIEQVFADQKSYDPAAGLRLPPRVRDLEIDFTALSFVAPEKVHFRYKLEGFNKNWHDLDHRQVFYANLPPGNYKFRVMASNNSGVWNEAGASLDFAIAPAYWQTWWFRSACVIGFLGLAFAAYRFRLHQVEQQFNTRLEGRVAERTRIARDLHDTLLQTVQGLSLKLYAVTYTLPDSSETRKTLENLIEQARQAVTESRDVVHGLRSSTFPANEIAQAISSSGDELAAGIAVGDRPDFCVQVEGEPRDMAPLLKDEVYRIGCEALRNAFQHARASRIEVEIHYDPRRFRLRVRDNGKGIAPEVLERGRAGHFGLASLHERAQTVGGKMAVWSKLHSGTEVELTIPASIAYAKSSVARESTSSKKPV